MRGIGMGLVWHGGVRLAGGGALPFSDTFTRGDGILGAPWLGGATWQIASGKAVNTPTLGAELVVNGGFDADTDWTKDAGWTIAGGKGIATNATAANMRQNILTIGAWYLGQVTISEYSGGSYRFIQSLGGQLVSRMANGTYLQSDLAKTDTWLYNNAVAVLTAKVDNVSVKPLTLATLFDAINAGTPNVDVSAAATIVAGTQAGVVVNLDSLSSPAFFVIGYHDGVAAKLEKAVNGVYTTLVTATTAYSAGAAVRVVKSGNVFKLYYNSLQIGADKTVTDLGIISNTLHGIMSTYEGNSLDNVSIAAS